MRRSIPTPCSSWAIGTLNQSSTATPGTTSRTISARACDVARFHLHRYDQSLLAAHWSAHGGYGQVVCSIRTWSWAPESELPSYPIQRRSVRPRYHRLQRRAWKSTATYDDLRRRREGHCRSRARNLCADAGRVRARSASSLVGAGSFRGPDSLSLGKGPAIAGPFLWPRRSHRPRRAWDGGDAYSVWRAMSCAGR